MSDDGADYGITVDRALDTVLGGKPSPTRDEGMSREEMRAYLESAPDDPANYEDCARIAGKVVLGFLERHPEHQQAPADSEYEYPPDFDWSSVEKMREVRTLKALGIDDAMKQTEPDTYRLMMDALGLTGFQWGWACNAAKYVLELPPVANPAIMTIGSE